MTSTDAAHAAVTVASAPVDAGAIPVKGPNFDEPQTLHGLLSSYKTVGFQATSFGKAVDVVDEMVSILVLQFTL